jgi:preprotein translocase subunit Sss1
MNDKSTATQICKKGDRIEGDRIFASCQKPGKWEEYQKSKQHNAHKCILRKHAIAIVEKPFTNIKS